MSGGFNLSLNRDIAEPREARGLCLKVFPTLGGKRRPAPFFRCLEFLFVPPRGWIGDWGRLNVLLPIHGQDAHAALRHAMSGKLEIGVLIL